MSEGSPSPWQGGKHWPVPPRRPVLQLKRMAAAQRRPAVGRARALRLQPGMLSLFCFGLALFGALFGLPLVRLMIFYWLGAIIGYWHLCIYRHGRLISLLAAILNGVALGLSLFILLTSRYALPPMPF